MGSTLQTRVGAAVADRYEVSRELARGGMAVVFLAHDRKHDRRVALKVLDPDVAAAVGADRFHREIRLLARLQHPHVCPLLDSGDADGALYYVMPFVAGESLRERLARGPLPVGEAVRLAGEVADALGYAHGRGVVHRDVKPENILLSGDVERGDKKARVSHAVVCDFGIARLTGRDSAAALALSNELHTGTGIAVGTPAYMSPEQALGERDIDGRADVYALGVVLYEMLTGALPYAESTPRAALAARLGGRPTRIADLCPEVSPALDAVIARALAPEPADRWPTADAMRAALVAALESPAPTIGRTRRRRRALVGGTLALVALGAVGAAMLRVGTRDPPADAARVDPSLYAVLPFATAGTGTAVDGEESEQLLRGALGRWTDVRLVDPLRVNDARLRLRAPSAMTLHDARRVARTLGAGTLAWGRVQRVAGRTVVYAALYDVARGDDEPLRGSEVTLAPTLADAATAFSALADSLLVGAGTPSEARAGASGTRSVEAWRAYARGHAALARWDLAAARDAFTHATRADDAYAYAWLWRAQTLAWSGDASSDSLRAMTARAAALAERLPPQDALAARALAALVERRFPEACADYARLVARDSLSFTAWYGLGECRARDDVVVPSAAAPSGWAFRGGYESAMAGYRRALAAVPTVHLAFRGSAFARLQALLFTDAERLRGGRTADGRMRFAAFPELAGDTLAFAPRPIEQALGAPPPPTMRQAVERNRRALREVADAWVREVPQSFVAHETLARALELTGQLDGPQSAARAAATARRLATTPADRLRLAVLAARIEVKRGRWDAAERLADSTLGTLVDATPGELAHGAGLAALTGRRAMLAAMLRGAAPTWVFGADLDTLVVPAPLAARALALRGFAALGGPADSVRRLADDVTASIATLLPRERRPLARRLLVDDPLELAFPALGALRPVPPPDPRDGYVRRMQAMLAAGRRDDVRAELARVDASRSGVRPGDVAIDGVFLEAALQAAVGDSAGAARRLDRALDALDEQGVSLLGHELQAAALPRAMLLRAALARARDPAAARWAAAVDTLWRRADPELRALARSAPR